MFLWNFLFLFFSFFPVVCFYIEYWHIKMFLLMQCKETVSIVLLDTSVEVHHVQTSSVCTGGFPVCLHFTKICTSQGRLCCSQQVFHSLIIWLIHWFTVAFLYASSTNIKELERVHRGSAWQIVGVALVLPHTKQESLLPLRWTNLHQAASDL